MPEPSYNDPRPVIPWGQSIPYARTFLRELLKERPLKGKVVFAKGLLAGHNSRAIYRAKKLEGIVTQYVEGVSYWYLPDRIPTSTAADNGQL